MKKFFKSASTAFRRVFHNRKIVIVSEGKASTINISRNFQLVMATLVLAGICLIPFSAGKFIAISSQSNKYYNHSSQNVEQRVEVLQNDILLLQEYLRALHKYDNFELNKTEEYVPAKTAHKQSPSNDEVSQLEEQRDDIMVELKKRTLTRIYTIENFLHSAGLDYTKITGKPQLTARITTPDGQGGPYIPATIDDIKNSEQDADISSEFIDEMNYLFELQKIVNNLPFSNPVAYNRVSSPFGVRHDPFNGHLSMHAGLDLQGDVGSQVAAAGPGKVTWAGPKGAYGNMVEIYHGYGFTTRYGHLSAYNVKVGDYVTRGQIIATQGCTGRCTGDHVHYEVRVNDIPTNPLTFLAKAAEIQYYYAKKL